MTAQKGSSKLHVLRITPIIGADPNAVQEALNSIATVELKGIEVKTTIGMKKPSIFIRKISHCREGSVENLLMEFGAIRTQVIKRSREIVPPDLAVSYFDSEDVALSALRKLKTITLDGRRITASYKSTSEPAVEVSNLPLNTTEFEVTELFKSLFLKPVRVQLLSGSSSNASKAIVTMADPREADMAVNAFLKTVKLKQKRITTSLANTDDIAMTISADKLQSSDIQKLITAIKASELVANLVELPKISQVSALLSFNTLNQALQVHADITSGKTDPGSDSVVSKVIGLPSYTVEVSGFSPNSPSNDLLSHCSSDGLVTVIDTTRSALLKFRKHSEVLQGMLKLNKCMIDGKRLKAIKYSPLEINGDSDFDKLGFEEEWDQFSLQHVLKDFMHADPATRWQVARNQFERAFKDATINKSITTLLDDSTPEAIKKEMLAMVKGDIPRDLERAFQLFVQREDMLKFSYDFNEMKSLFGPPDSSDPYNWSEFQIEDVASLNKLENHMKHELQEIRDQERYVQEGAGFAVRGGPFEKAVKAASQKMSNEKELDVLDDATSDDMNMDEDDDDDIGNHKKHGVGNRLTVEDENGEKVIDLSNPDTLTDADGHVWSGVILDTDTVQKTMPGNRVMSFRALVCVGNLRGAAGFGTAKGKNAPEAISAAFRDALRNLLYIDLFDNFGLAHDVQGKHNSCHAIIRATPQARLMVASPFAGAILKRFGISSASCKLIGRRNPYSMVRAMFNALEKHENIDEFAKARGQRYLTLRWAYDKKI